jgi:SPP1 gp7 family putative phage head morphogenesis protein
MSDLDTTIDRFRAALLRRERAAATDLVRAYASAWQRIRQRLDDLARQIAQATDRGEPVDVEWLLTQQRLQLLQQQVATEIATFAQVADARIVDAQRDAVQAGQQQAVQLLQAGRGMAPPGVTATFAKLPTGAVEDLVGFLQDGAPLRSLLDTFGPAAAQQVGEALLTGLATGLPVDVIATQIQAALGSTLARALTIARTEVLRSYRESSRRIYQANRDVVAGWIWHSATDRRTCAFCWSMHGTLHSVDEPMATHPNCRCGKVPLTRWAQPGAITPGTERFAQLPAATQRAILGPAKYAAYRAGALRLDDLRGFRIDPRWGPIGYERSLTEIVGPAQARRWRDDGLRMFPGVVE